MYMAAPHRRILVVSVKSKLLVAALNMEYPIGVIRENRKRSRGMCPWLTSRMVWRSIKAMIIADDVMPMAIDPDVIKIMTMKNTTSWLL